MKGKNGARLFDVSRCWSVHQSRSAGEKRDGCSGCLTVVLDARLIGDGFGEIGVAEAHCFEVYVFRGDFFVQEEDGKQGYVVGVLNDELQSVIHWEKKFVQSCAQV